MARSPGSGLYTKTANCIEALLAARLRGDESDAKLQVSALEAQRIAGRCGIPPGRIDRAISGLVDGLDLDIVSASRLATGHHADVVAVSRDGSRYAFEVKAQTTKMVSQLVEADWIREDTDGIARITSSFAVLQDMLSPETRTRLLVRNSRIDLTWNHNELIAGDIALLVNQHSRLEAGVSSVGDLASYAQSKYLVHLGTDGIRAALISEIPIFGDALGGSAVRLSFRANRVGVAAWLSRANAHAPEFSYHIYDGRGGLLGRHKLHARALDGITWAYRRS